MKKLLFYLLILGGSAYGQTKEQVIKHHGYTVYFNNSIKAPDSVSWDLTPAMLGCKKVTRVDKFAADPMLPGSPKPSDFVQLPAYKTDKTVELAKGHLFSYEDAMCNPQNNTECFYVDQMYSQYQNFNAGDWKTVEAYERQLAAKAPIHVIAGYVSHPIDGKGKPIQAIAQNLPTGVPIVSFMYKAIYHSGVWECWIMPNLPTTKGHKYSDWHVTVATLDAQTGLKL